MRAEISVPVLLLLFSGIVYGSSSTTAEPPSSSAAITETEAVTSSNPPMTSQMDTQGTSSTVSPMDTSTVPPKDTSTVPPPTTTTTVTTTEPVTVNPNIEIKKLADEYKEHFVKVMNHHRDTYLQGRFAYKLSWDDSLEETTAKRAESCSLQPVNGEDYVEVISTEKEWKYTLNLPDRLQTKLEGVTYMKGLSRVGCVEAISCDKNAYTFCHYAISQLAANPGFGNRAVECTLDQEYTHLCLDLAPPTPAPSTPLYRVHNPRKSAPDGFISVLSLFGGLYLRNFLQ